MGQHEMKTKVCSGLLESLATLATAGEEGRYLHDPWPLQDQDSSEASHQGRSEDGLWPGDEGEGQASQDYCQSVPSRCTQGADLRGELACHEHPRDLTSVGIPQSKFG